MWPTSTRSWWNKTQLTAWLAVGGRRIGLGDWRAEKQGGVFGRFDVDDVIELADAASARPPRRGRRPASAGKSGVFGRFDVAGVIDPRRDAPHGVWPAAAMARFPVR